MDELVNETLTDTGLSILYEDLVTTNASVGSTGVGGGVLQSQTVERDIAVSGRTVRSILVHEQDQGADNKVLGRYVSRDLLVPSSYNFRINDQRVYDRDINSQARKYNELSEVFGRPLMMPKQLYSFDADTSKKTPLNFLNQNSFSIGKIEGNRTPIADNSQSMTATEIRGSSHFIGYDASTTGLNVLGGGTPIGVKPISIIKTYQRQNILNQDNVRNMRVFASVERMMNIKNGKVLVSS